MTPLAVAERPPIDRLMTVKEVADTYGIGVRTVWLKVQSGVLPSPVKLGGATRWRASDVQDHLQSLAG